MAAVYDNIVPILDINTGKIEVCVLILGHNAAVIVVKRLFEVIGINENIVRSAQNDLWSEAGTGLNNETQRSRRNYEHEQQ